MTRITTNCPACDGQGYTDSHDGYGGTFEDPCVSCRGSGIRLITADPYPDEPIGPWGSL